MRLRPLALAAALSVAVVLVAGSPAAAITYGHPDGSAHPEAGALLADQAYSDGTWAYCSGTLVSPTVFLTAAHCGEPGQTTARVTFSTHYQVGDPVHVGTWHADPAYPGPTSDPHDIAVVVFAEPVTGITPATLPTAGLLDTMKKDGSLASATFTSVGYGSLEPVNGPGGKTYTYTDVRGTSSGTLNSLQSSWLRLSQNPSTGNGGTCFGDSGGPNYLGGATSHLLVATTITGDSVCRSTNVDYRLDSAVARAFLAGFVALP